MPKQPDQEDTPKPKRKRRVISFPTLPYDQVKIFAIELFKAGAGQAVRRLTLFDTIGKSPESGPAAL